MPRKGKRRRLAQSIYSDSGGISGIVIVRGVREELRFPFGTDLHEIRREMDTRRTQIDEDLGPAAMPGSVREIAERAIGKLADTRPDRDYAERLRAWIKTAGDEPLQRVKRATLDAVVEGWLRDGLSANTIAKRISSLRRLWQSVAPDDAPLHASERMKRPRVLKSALIRARPMDLVARVLAHVERGNRPRGDESKARARLQVLAWTAQPPALIQQIRPEHVRWSTDPPELYVQPRRKGAGVDAAWIPLLPQAVAALKTFFRVDADGVWNRGVIKRSWDRALKKTRAELVDAGRTDEAALLVGFRVYDLRHSAASSMLQSTGDLYATSEYLRHSDIRTTMIYTRAAASPRAKKAIAVWAKALGHETNKPKLSVRRVRKPPRS